MELCELKASMIYIENSRTTKARATSSFFLKKGKKNP